MGIPEVVHIPHRHINRDILECKLFLLFLYLVSSKILIETYWNVNTKEVQGAMDALGILIETYWNVNFLRVNR